MPDRIVQQTINVPEGVQLVTRLGIAKHLKDHPHVRLFNEALLDIVFNDELTGTDLRVLLYILASMEWENLFKESQAVIAEKLSIRQQQVSKSIRKLLANDWIRIQGQIGRQNVYRINPYLALKSYSRNYKALLADWDFVPLDEQEA